VVLLLFNIDKFLSNSLYLQVDSFNRALHRNTTAGKLTQLFKTKMLSRTSTSSGASPASASKSPNGSSGGGATAPLSADELLQWSNVSAYALQDSACAEGAIAVPEATA
jgi:hypothetical protein